MFHPFVSILLCKSTCVKDVCRHLTLKAPAQQAESRLSRFTHAAEVGKLLAVPTPSFHGTTIDTSAKTYVA